MSSPDIGRSGVVVLLPSRFLASTLEVEVGGAMVWSTPDEDGEVTT
jgi:hypothetical protein